jgi:hypothetical protein
MTTPVGSGISIGVFALGILCALLIGFLVGRELPRETLLERECRVWAERLMQEQGDHQRTRFGLLLGGCMKGGR